MRRDRANDVTAGFTDMQWYMYHQRNVAFFAAYTARAFDEPELLSLARTLIERAPQLLTGFAGAGSGEPIADAVLARLIYRESVDSLAGFPDRWIDSGDAIFAEPAVPLFRLRYAAARAPASDGRCGFLLVQVAHALAEGADSALLSRSRSTERVPPPHHGASLVDAAAWLAGTLLPPFHLLAAYLRGVRPGPYAYASRTVPRADLSNAARGLGVRQRALLYSLAMQTLFDPRAAHPRARISSAYSTLSAHTTSGDPFMQMRMLFARFTNTTDFDAFVRAVDARLTMGESRETGFNAALNARGVHMHRRLARLIPFAYGPRLFQFTPFDIVLALLPPHRLGGNLARDLVEPLYAGATLEGVNACVIVPSRTFVTFNFYVEAALLPQIPRLEDLVSAVIARSSGDL